MREDMAKVITEEERRGRRIKDRKGAKRDWDRIPDDEKPYKETGGVRRKWIMNWRDSKEFGEHLGPLKRFALSCVGRNWDEVYSEICQCIDKGNVTQNHILTHLYQYINVKVKMVNGKPYEIEYPFTPVQAIYGTVVYVDPDTKIIKRAPTYKKRKYKQERSGPRIVDNGRDGFYMQDEHSGIWYQCWMKKCPEPYVSKIFCSYRNCYYDKKVYASVYDHFYGFAVSGSPSGNSTKGYYCYKKLQLNKREIKKLLKQIDTN